MLKRIYVNRDALDKAGNYPLLITCSSGVLDTASRVTLHVGSELVYEPDRPLLDGAVCWLETNGPVIATTPRGRQEIL